MVVLWFFMWGMVATIALDAVRPWERRQPKGDWTELPFITQASDRPDPYMREWR